MKKIVLLVTLVLSGLITSQTVPAQNTQINNKETTEQDKFYQIDEKDIPQILLEAINRSYADSLIKSIFVSNNSTYTKYKVILTTREQKMLKVYFDDKGKVIKELSYHQQDSGI